MWPNLFEIEVSPLIGKIENGSKSEQFNWPRDLSNETLLLQSCQFWDSKYFTLSRLFRSIADLINFANLWSFLKLYIAETIYWLDELIVGFLVFVTFWQRVLLLLVQFDDDAVIHLIKNYNARNTHSKFYSKLCSRSEAINWHRSDNWFWF